MAEIHSTALVDPGAQLASDVSVGAFSIIKAGVTIGPGTVVREHCHIHGNALIGSHCQIGPAAYLGLPPQHVGYDGNETWLMIGDHVIIRETASVHRSMHQGQDHATRVGDRCFLMAGSHVGHDCQLGVNVVLANAVLLGGHCLVGDRAFIGGGATIHQYCRIGRIAIIAGNETLTQDAPPFSAVRYGGLKGYNAVGCKRASLSRQAIHAIRGAFLSLHTNRTMPRAIAEIRERIPALPEIEELLDFIATTRRGVSKSVRFRVGRVEAAAASNFLDVDSA